MIADNKDVFDKHFKLSIVVFNVCVYSNMF